MSPQWRALLGWKWRALLGLIVFCLLSHPSSDVPFWTVIADTTISAIGNFWANRIIWTAGTGLQDDQVVRATVERKNQLYRRFPINSNSVRVLVLEPSDGIDRVRCRLKVQRIGSSWFPTPAFDALSYTWGKVLSQQFVWLEGVPVEVSDSLYAALFNLRKRSPDATRIIWVDQLCINQADNFEVSREMRKQHLVYGKAKRVIVWLGQALEESDLALSYFRKLLRSAGTLSDSDLQKSYLNNRGHWTYIGPGLLLRREWWNRTWTIQEVMLAKMPILWCGEQHILFDDFLRIMEFAWKNNIRLFPDRRGVASQVGPDIYRPSLTQFRDFRQLMTAGGQPLLCEWLARFNLQKCTKDQDRIYGYLGLAGTEFLESFTTDVTLHANNVFLNATIAIVQKYKALDFICLGHGPNRRQNTADAPYLPSWVPDLAADATRLARPLPLNYYPKPAFNASASRSYAFSFTGFDSRQLILYGYLVDKVQNMTGFDRYDEAVYKAMYNSTRSPVETVHETWFDTAQEIAGATMDDLKTRGLTSPYANTDNGIANAFWRTLVCDMRPSGDRQGPELAGIHRILQSKDAPDDFHPGQDEHARAQSWQWVRGQEKYWWSNGRRFVTTSKGYYAIAPFDAETGDSIFVVDGASVPYVLRPAGTGKWKLIGER